MSSVGQSPRERGSPVRGPRSSPSTRAGAHRRNRPTRSTTLHGDRDERAKSTGGFFLHVPHLSQYDGQSAGTTCTRPPGHNLNSGPLCVTGQIESQIRSVCDTFPTRSGLTIYSCPSPSHSDRIRIHNSIVLGRTGMNPPARSFRPSWLLRVFFCSSSPSFFFAPHTCQQARELACQHSGSRFYGHSKVLLLDVWGGMLTGTHQDTGEGTVWQPGASVRVNIHLLRTS